MKSTFYSENDFRLYHHGIKGQRWGIRRYQNPDGSLTEEGKRRYGHKSDDIVIKKGKKLIRYSSVDEKHIRQGTYANADKKEDFQYRDWAAEGFLGFDKVDDFYRIRYKAIDKVYIRSGKQVIDDVLNDIGNVKFSDIKANYYLEKDFSKYNKKIQKQVGNSTLNDFYKKLNDKGYLNDQGRIDTQRKQFTRVEDLQLDALLDSIGDYQKKHGAEFIKQYKDVGYDAIIDPEDFLIGMHRPVIITNPDKFKILKR